MEWSLRKRKQSHRVKWHHKVLIAACIVAVFSPQSTLWDITLQNTLESLNSFAQCALEASLRRAILSSMRTDVKDISLLVADVAGSSTLSLGSKSIRILVGSILERSSFYSCRYKVFDPLFCLLTGVYWQCELLCLYILCLVFSHA